MAPPNVAPATRPVHYPSYTPLPPSFSSNPAPSPPHQNHGTVPRAHTGHGGCPLSIRPTITARLAAALLAAALPLLPGCAAAPSGTFDTFSRDKMVSLNRAIQAAADNQNTAAQRLTEAVNAVAPPLETGLPEGPPGDPAVRAHIKARYEDARRMSSRAEDAAHRADAATKTAAATAESIWLEWRNEISRYHDSDYQEVASKAYHAQREETTRILNSLRNANRANRPVVKILQDRTLHFKHSLAASKPLPEPYTAEEVQAAVGEMLRRTVGVEGSE